MSRRFLGLISVALFSLAFVHTAYAFTSPGNPTGFVNDFANVLAPAEKTALETKLKDFAMQTGNEVSVVIVQNLGGDVIENYAVELFQAWGIGNKEKDNGVLFLVAIDDRAVRIEVGYGLEGDLPDATANRIIQKIAIPYFKNGDYVGGISNSADAIMSALGGNTDVIPEESDAQLDSNLNLNLNFVFVIGFIVVSWLGAILGRSKSWWLGGVIGGVAGIIVIAFFGFLYIGLIALSALIPLGLLFDFIASRQFEKSKTTGRRPPWWIGGGRMGGGGFGGSGGGFGGFGGGSSGGGGASGRW
ncbi:MAG: TPM domain-containing protein [Candidatus Pacebacteria bacterium]|nr:TPM domain-containing protein [Candidatus Paceibacterota bacterium]MDD5356980.1 TPM domain-containing protein [Candidatus Paceibacterota bacterium]